MPPSPGMRSSPAREMRADNHKRGRSLEGGILFREKDEELALFKEVQGRERNNFLLQSNDDFEDAFNPKLGISIPVRGECSELLNAEGVKNDYDWLLTPPDTPLFTSLDDETPTANLAQKGRPRSEPISISRSSMMEKSHRSSTCSSSPNRLSPSPWSGNSTVQTRGMKYSARHSSPTPSLQHVAPSRRPSPPPSKPSSPTLRSTTPTPRRLCTSSTGISPVKATRGNSASPKARAWQSSIPGFFPEAPPNLRTSLADRPASYVRGSSPGSRNGKVSPSKSGRQLTSQTASRSISSSRSHDGDRVSFHSKGSIASSGDGDVDSLLYLPPGTSGCSSIRKVGSLPNNRALAFSKKPSIAVASNSAPKRSLDVALRQMDHRKSAQNMFRPLLSSVPSSTFYVGDTSDAQRAIISTNSSVTTGSHENSGQANSGGHDTEGNEENQEDVSSANVEVPYPGASNGNVGHGIKDGALRDFSGRGPVDCNMDDFENLGDRDTDIVIKKGSLVVDGRGDMVLCSNCGRTYCTIESNERDFKLCPDCSRSNVSLTIGNAVTAASIAENSPGVLSKNILEESDSFDVIDSPIAAPESSGGTSIAESGTGQHENSVTENQTPYHESIWNFLPTDSLSRTLVAEGDHHANRQPIDYPLIKADALEGAGTSVLLNRSSSGKGAVLQIRSFTASSISYDDPSYARDSSFSLRSSYGHGSVSASSSLDLGSYKQTETCIQRQSSGKKSDLDNYWHEMYTEHRRTGSSLSGNWGHAFQPLGLSTSLHEESFDTSPSPMQNDVGENLINQEQFLPSENMEEDDVCTDIESNYRCRTLDASTSKSSSYKLNMHLEHNRVSSFSNSEEYASHEIGEDLSDNRKNVGDVEESAITAESSILVEETLLSSCVDVVKVVEDPSQTSLHKISEIVSENAHQGSSDTRSDIVSSSSSSTDKLVEPHIAVTSDKDITTSLVESDNSDHEDGTLEESTEMVESRGGSKARSLTLEEVTDTILICSSIIYSIAYDAATIAIEKEDPVHLEVSRPMVTLLGNANPERKDPRGRTPVESTSKSQKASQMQVETDAKPPKDSKNDVFNKTRIVGIYNNNDDRSMKAPPKTESKCNCTTM